MTSCLNTKEKNETEINAFIDRLAELLLMQIKENKEIGEAGGRAREKIKPPSGKDAGRQKAITLSASAGIGFNINRSRQTNAY